MRGRERLQLDPGPEPGLVVGGAVVVEVFDALAADVGTGPHAGAGPLPDLAGQGLLQGLSPGSTVPPGSVQSVSFQVTRTIWESG